MIRGGSRGGGGGGGGGELHGTVAPFPVLTTPLVYTWTRVGTSDKNLTGSSVLEFFQWKTACDSQNGSDTESTRAGDENGSQLTDDTETRML